MQNDIGRCLVSSFWPSQGARRKTSLSLCLQLFLISIKFLMRKKYDWFSLTFRNISSGESRDVRFIVEPGVLAQKWAGLLQRLLQSETILRKNNVLSSWATTPRDLNYLCSELNRHISLINKFYANKPKDFHYHIRWHFEPGTVDQKLLNLIHHDFEVITGPTWNISRRYKMAPRDIRFSVQQLNNLESFAEGWLQGDDVWGRPVDVEIYKDGSLLVSDDKAGVIYQISYSPPPHRKTP